MWNKLKRWFKGLFGQKPRQTEVLRDGRYEPWERLLFHWWDGEKEVWADPTPLCMELADIWPELIVDMKLANSEHSQAKQGWKAQVAKARKLFGLKTFAEGGLTDTESMAVLYDFYSWCEELKKNSPQSPTSATETSPSSASTSAEGPPTKSTSPSGSSGNGSSTGKPGPSTSASPSPSEGKLLA